MVFSPVQQDIRIHFSTPCKRPLSGDLARSVASRACGSCTASIGVFHTLRFSGPCGIYRAAGRRHRKYPCLRAQAGCGRAILVEHVAVQQRLGASVSLTACPTGSINSAALAASAACACQAERNHYCSLFQPVFSTASGLGLMAYHFDVVSVWVENECRIVPPAILRT